MKQSLPDPQSVQSPSVQLSTIIGCGALLVWSVYALVISELVVALPVFQTLFLMFGISFFAMSIRLTLKKQWSILWKQPYVVWLVGVVGVCGSDIAYVTAVKYAPPAHVDFIDYLWPFLVIIFTGFLPKEKFTLQHFIAGALGFIGVLSLLTTSRDFFGFKDDYVMGYWLAFASAFIWSTYTIVSRYYKDTPIELVGLFCGIGAVISLVLHLKFETWVTPSLYEGSMLAALGLSSGIAYTLWTYGTQKGNIKLLSILAYFTPVISMTLLVLCNKEPLSVALIVACVLVVSGVAVGSMNLQTKSN